MRDDYNIDSSMGVDLKTLLDKIYRFRFLFLVSIALFLFLALVYILIATPKYEVSTSLIIDPSGDNRALGESRYIEGGVDLIELEKNLFNEVAILKSYNLINQTITELDLDVTYYSSELFNQREHYGYFPFQVVLDRKEPQLYGLEFEVKPLEGNQFQLSVKGKNFLVSNPTNESNREVERRFDYSETHSFGQKINHEYFNFSIKKPDYEVNNEDFKGYDLSFMVHRPGDVVDGYRSNLTVENIDIQASIFKVATTGTLVEKEVAFLKKYTHNYIENKLTSRDKIAAGKEDFIREQLRIVSDSLSKSQIALESFKKDEQVVNLGVTGNNALAQSQSLQTRAAKIRIDIGYYNSLIKSIEENKQNEDFTIPTTIGINDALLNNNILELNRLYTERSRKRFYVTGNNEEIRILNGQIEEATNLLLSNLRSAIKAANVELGGIYGQISSYGDVISDLPTREKQLLNIERDNTLYDNLFNYLSQELAKTAIARAESTTDTRILDDARMVGDGPVSPQRYLLFTLAFLLGTLLPLGWIVLFAPSDTIESINQIVSNTNLPLIASVVHYEEKEKEEEEKEKIKLPKVAPGKLKDSISDLYSRLKPIVSNFPKNGSVVLNGSGDSSVNPEVALWMHKESFRDLYANLKLVKANEDNVLAVSSTLPDEGKTYISINLGITLAEAGHKTLILDMDLRKPGLADSLQKVQGNDLSHYLQNSGVRLTQIIHKHESLENLDFIPSTVIRGNVQQLLSGSKMGKLITDLKKKYDFVILDTPAIGLVSDFLLFSEHVDINLFVLRRNIAKIKFIKDYEGLTLNEENMKSYIVFNGILKKSFKYGYGDKYGVNEEKHLVNKSLSV